MKITKEEFAKKVQKEIRTRELVKETKARVEVLNYIYAKKKSERARW